MSLQLRPAARAALLFLPLLVFLGAAWIFGGIAGDVVAGDPLTVFDRQIAVWFHEHQNDEVTSFLSAVSAAHEWPVVTLVALLFLAYLSWRRSWEWATFLICAVPGGMLLNALLKLVFHRARPNLSDLAATLNTYSFPSGHVMAAAVLYGGLAAYLVSKIDEWRWSALTVWAAISLVALVALSRMYLGVHYLSDVLAASAEGVAWLALCYIAVSTRWRRAG